MYKKQKKIKQTIKETIFRFWNTGIEYFCIITSPTDIPKYRLKEVFDKNFIGKKDIYVLEHGISDFKKLSEDITYEVKPVKEK